MSSINRVLRNLASSKEQSTHHLSAAAADSVYDKLRMFNGQAAAAAGWAWYGKSHFIFPNRLNYHLQIFHLFVCILLRCSNRRSDLASRPRRSPQPCATSSSDNTSPIWILSDLQWRTGQHGRTGTSGRRQKTSLR